MKALQKDIDHLQPEEDDMTKVEGTSRRIVVGIDGSECSLAALQWAARQAQLTDSPLEVCMSWERLQYGLGFVLPDSFDPESEARTLLDDEINKIRIAFSGVEFSPVLVEGHPAPALVEATRGADLLVVGSHGYGAFTGMMLGSVSEYCVQHVSCPITIVRQ